MAIIANKFLYFPSLAKYNAKKDEIADGSIVFVDQPAVAESGTQGEAGYVAPIAAKRFIATHGKEFETNFDPATINAAIEALDGRLDTLEAGDTVSGSVAYAVKTLSNTIMGLLGTGFDTTDTVAKGISDVNDRIDGLDLTEVKETGKAIIAVSQANGQVSAEAGDIAAAHVAVADSAEKFTGTTVEAVLAEIDTAYKAAIAALDFTDTPAVKKVVTGVSEENGVISVSRKELKSTDKTVTITQATTSDDIDFAVNIDGTTILKDANTGVLSVASSALVQYVGDGKTVAVGAESNGEKQISTTIKIAEVTTGLNSNVEKAWDLVDANGDVITGSSRIIVKKDNSFVNGKIGHVDDTINASTGAITDGTGNAAIDLIYKNNEGNYVLIAIDIEQYLREAEFKDGLAVNNHEVSVKLSSNTESAKYLKIQAITGENGAIELSGIDAAIAAASSSIAAKTTGHVTVSSTSDANGTVYTIAENDIASAAGLAQEITDRQSGDATLLGANTDASTANTIYGAKKGVEEAKAAAATAKTVVNAKTPSTDEHITVTVTQDSTDSHDIVTISENDIASAQLVGTIPNGATATTVTDYAAEVASDEANAAETAAKSYADAIKVNNKTQTSQAITIDGGDIALTGYTAKTGAGSGDVTATDTVNAAIKKVETKVDNLDSASPFEYASGKESSHSTVLKGENLNAQNEGEVAIGKYNVSRTGSTAANTTFTIGNGTSATPANAFEVRENGDVYVHLPIGTLGADVYAKLQEIIANEINWYEG